jgi:hypothetical protein
MAKRKARPSIGPDEANAHRSECWLLALDAALGACAVLVDAVLGLSGPDAEEHADAVSGCRKDLEEALLWVSRSRRLP